MIAPTAAESSQSAADGGTTTTSASAATTSSTTSRPPEVPAGKANHKRKSTPTVDSNASIPAGFVILTGDKLSPSSIAVPARVTVDLTVANRDDAPHTLTLDAGGHHALQVQAGGSATATIAGLPNGVYQVLVDGSPRGQLSVGAQGGP